ncbi:MAG: hypothetical protein H0U03_00020 [Actinobacteria bacterium]|nr:hypothetical protein [Actinomycetota bacterium]
MSQAVLEPEGQRSEPLAKASLAAAILAVLAFFGLGFAFEGWWFVVGLVLGAIAVILGLMTRRRPIAASDRRLATIGLVLGSIIVLWFVTYMVIDAIA